MRPQNGPLGANSPAERLHGAGAQPDWRSALARAGLAAKGVLYAAIGLLALDVVTADPASQTASKRGAIELVASQPFGQWLLGLLTAGLFALAIWRLILAFKGDPVEGSEAKDRAKFTGEGLIYLGTASTAFTILLANWGRASAAGGGGASTQDQAAATVMSWPGGPWLVGLLGAAVIGAAIYQFKKHVADKAFMQRLAIAEMRAKVRTAVERAGRAGYSARAIVLAIVGVFFIVAAIQHDPQEAVGLSGALQALTGLAWGKVVLWIVAIGLFLFGCFSFAEAKYRRAV